MDVAKLKKPLLEELVKDPPSHSQTANELDAQVYSLISVIETAIALAIPKARLLSKSVPGVGISWKCSELDGIACFEVMETHGISWNLGEYSVSVT